VEIVKCGGCEVCSVERGVLSVKCGVWNVECEVWSGKCGVWGVERDVSRVKCGVKHAIALDVCCFCGPIT